MSSASSASSPRDAGTSGSSARSPLTSRSSVDSSDCAPPMTREVLANVASHLAEQDCLAASAVCRSWRAALLGCPRLWSDFRVLLPSPHVESKLAFYQQCGPVVKTANLFAYLEHQATERRWEQVREQLHLVCHAPCLDDTLYLGVMLQIAAGKLAHGIWEVLQALGDERRFASLSTLVLHLHAYDFGIDGSFLSYLTDVSEQVVVSCTNAGRGAARTSRLVDFPAMTGHSGQGTSMMARHLRLAGITLGSNLEIPLAKRLNTLHLTHCTVGRSLFALLERAPELYELRLQHVFREPESFGDARRDPMDGDDETDDEMPPDMEDEDAYYTARARRQRGKALPVTLPRLRVFVCTGPRTPCFWTAAGMRGARDILMPNLDCAILVSLSDLDLEVPASDLGAFELEEDEEFEEYLTDPLQTLCNKSPFITELDISAAAVSDMMLPSSLHPLAKLRKLVATQCNSLSDEFVADIYAHSPHLEELDVRGCGHISAIGVARCVEVFLYRGSRLRRVWMEEVWPSDLHSPYREHREWSEAKAYEWLCWLDIIEPWREHDVRPAELKKPLLPRLSMERTRSNDSSRRIVATTTAATGTSAGGSSSRHLYS